MDAEKFGSFVAGLRKERNLTQKQLAEQLFISDKAVSKWERGLSLPDIMLLEPLAESLGVSVTELLRGERLDNVETMSVQDVEKLVTDSLTMSMADSAQRSKTRIKWLFIYLGELAVVALEIWLLRYCGIGWEEMVDALMVIELLPLIFGIWFFFFIWEQLPYYYDKDKISFYRDGAFCMSLGGFASLNNRNWPHILKAGRLYCLLVPTIYPLIYLLLRTLVPYEIFRLLVLPLTLFVILGGLFLPMIYVGRKYEK